MMTTKTPTGKADTHPREAQDERKKRIRSQLAEKAITQKRKHASEKIQGRKAEHSHQDNRKRR